MNFISLGRSVSVYKKSISLSLFALLLVPGFFAVENAEASWDGNWNPVCGFESKSNRTIVTIDKGLFWGTETETEPIPVNLSAGKYDVWLAAADGYDNRASANQTNERYFVSFLNSGGSTIANSNITDDLDNSVDFAYLEQKVNSELNLIQDVKFIRARHAHHLNGLPAHSLTAVCAAFDKIVETPTADIKANGSNGPITISYNSSATISWTSQNADSCTVSPGGWSGTSGSQSSGSLTSSRTYNLECTGPGGSASDSVTVNVESAPAISADIKANGSNGPITIPHGNSATISWTSQNADSCTVSPGGWSGTSGSQSSGSLTSSKTYNLNCTGPGGTANDSVTVNVQQSLPTVSITANPSSINRGNNSVLSWTSSNATQCTASGGWSGGKALSGSQSVSPQSTTTYTITCSNQAGSASDSTTVTVAQQQLPTVSISANPQQINKGNSSALSWTSSNATQCTASGGWSGGKALSGSQSVSPQSTTTYTITCSNQAGSASDSTTVTVLDLQVPPTVSINANPSNINIGNSSLLTWNSSNADFCFASGGWSGGKALSGSQSVSPQSTTSYTITCNNQAGSASDSVTVTVAQQQLPTVSITANPSSINRGNNSVLSWTSSNATQCTASGGWSGGKALSSSQSVSPQSTTTYTITCSNQAGSVSSNATVHVVDVGSPPTVTLLATPSSINRGESSVLSWTSQNASTCVASMGWSGSKALSGNQSVFPTQTTSYSITCSNQYGSNSRTVTVSVLDIRQLQITKAVRNITLNQTNFSTTNEAQGMDVLEFRVTVRNAGNSQENVTLRDVFPSQYLHYSQGTTRINGVAAPDGIAGGTLSLGNISPGEEKIVTFQAVVFFNVPQQTVTNEIIAESGTTTERASATIQIRNRGTVLGAATIVTGPENPLPWILGIGFLGSLIIYLTVFRLRFGNGMTLKNVYYDALLKRRLRQIKRTEKYSDLR